MKETEARITCGQCGNKALHLDSFENGIWVCPHCGNIMKKIEVEKQEK